MDTKSSAGAALVKIQDLINDAKCFEVVRDLRWPEGVFCLHCGNEHVIKFGRDECYVPPYSRLFVASYSGVRQEECPTL